VLVITSVLRLHILINKVGKKHSAREKRIKVGLTIEKNTGTGDIEGLVLKHE